MSNTLGKFRTRIAQFLRDTSGAPAVEFALISPILIVLFFGMRDINAVAVGTSNMQTGVRAGIQYAITGGTDATEAQSQADSAWTKKPSGGTVTATKACKCSGSASACDTACGNGDLPEMYMTVSATATFGGDFYTGTKTVTETVRVR